MSQPTSRRTMRDVVDEYLARRKQQVAATTLKGFRSTLFRFAGWADSPIPGTKGTRRAPHNLTGAHMETFLWATHRCVEGCYGQTGRFHRGPGLRDSCGPASFNTQLGRLRGFFVWASRHGHVRAELVDTVTGDQRARVRLRRRLQLTPDQLTELIEGAGDPYDRAVCALAVYTAGRGSELLSLRIEDVDLDNGEILWARRKTGDYSDTLPITNELAHELERWFEAYRGKVSVPLRDRWFLIPRRDSSPGPTGKVVKERLSYFPDKPRCGALWTVVKPHIARVLGTTEEELRGEGVHTLRRSMSRALYERLNREGRADAISIVQALLGHTNPAMTEHYIGVESRRRARDETLRGKSMLGGS